jgi:hypothetical protein
MKTELHIGTVPMQLHIQGTTEQIYALRNLGARYNNLCFGGGTCTLIAEGNIYEISHMLKVINEQKAKQHATGKDDVYGNFNFND